MRELRNVVEKHVALASTPVLTLEEISDSNLAPHAGIDADNPTLAELERRYLAKVVDRCAGNRTQAARVLGIDKSTLWRKMQNMN